MYCYLYSKIKYRIHCQSWNATTLMLQHCKCWLTLKLHLKSLSFMTQS